MKLLSRVQLFATPWMAAHQAPPSMGFARQEYWSGVPLPSPSEFLKASIIYLFMEKLFYEQKVRIRCLTGKGIKNMLRTWHWRRQWHPTPVLLPGKSHGQRSLVGCSPWDREESDTTERLHFHFSFSCIGEGNGNPLPCSCLENPRDEGAWWAAVYGVAQSQTRLKRLSSSSSNAL